MKKLLIGLLLITTFFNAWSDDRNKLDLAYFKSQLKLKHLYTECTTEALSLVDYRVTDRPITLILDLQGEVLTIQENNGELESYDFVLMEPAKYRKDVYKYKFEDKCQSDGAAELEIIMRVERSHENFNFEITRIEDGDKTSTIKCRSIK